MGEARRCKTSSPPRARASRAARQLLTAIADAQRAAVVLKEAGDDDLPGAVDDFVLLYPDGTNRAVTEEFMRRAALAFFASQRFELGKPPPKATHADLPRMEKLIAEMRAALRTRNNALAIAPPRNWAELL